MDFTGMFYRFTITCHLPETQERLERYCLKHYCERSLKLCDWSSIQVSLFLLT